MPLNNFTKAGFEARAADQWNLLVAALANLAELDARAQVELSAGTFDLPEFYPPGKVGVQPDEQSNILGALDVAGQIHAWLHGKGQVPAPPGDPLGYANFLLGF